MQKNHFNIKAKKSLGQNFLQNENILDQIVSISPIENENIIEIGPGYGALTQKILLKKPSSLDLVELDKDMVNILQDRILKKDFFIENTILNIFNQDILLFSTPKKDYKIFANIPYYITSPILTKFLYKTPNKPKEMIILMQEEVGDRIIDKKSSVLSLIVQKKCTTFKKIFVGPENFSPRPKVNSCVIHFILNNLYENIDDDKFLNFIKQSFIEPRKKIINNLSKFGYDKNLLISLLNSIGFDENVRAEQLSIDNYIYLLEKL